MNTKKIMLIIALSVVGACAAGAGIVHGVKSYRKSEVLVVPVNDINNGYYQNGDSAMSGIVTSDVSQDVFLEDTQTVEQVLVKEGDVVREGDVLLTYDMTLTNLDLEMQKLSRDQVDLKLQTAKNELKKLNNTKPSKNSGLSAEDQEPADEPTADPTDAPVTPPTTPAEDAEVFNGTDNPLDYKSLTEAKYYRGEGTINSPYSFLCENNTVIEASFMNAMMGYAYDAEGKRGERKEESVCFRLEVRADDKLDGALIKAWVQDASQFMEPFADDWKGVIDLTQKEILPKALIAASVSARNLSNLDTNQGSSFGVASSKAELEKAIKEKEKEIKELELNLREQDIKLRVTQKAVDDGQVVAGISGVIKKVGDSKNPPKDGSAFLSVSSSEGLYVKGTVSELCLDAVQEGTTITVTSWQSGATCEATVKEVSSYPETGYNDYDNSNASGYPFTAYIASGGDQLQNYENVQISVSQQMSADMAGGNAISLSKAFIREEEGVKYVYIRDEEGRLKRQEVQIGQLFWGDTYEIKGGITTEDWIAFPYGKYVKEGAKTKEGTMSQLYGY